MPAITICHLIEFCVWSSWCPCGAMYDWNSRCKKIRAPNSENCSTLWVVEHISFALVNHNELRWKNGERENFHLMTKIPKSKYWHSGFSPPLSTIIIIIIRVSIVVHISKLAFHSMCAWCEVYGTQRTTATITFESIIIAHWAVKWKTETIR